MISSAKVRRCAIEAPGGGEQHMLDAARLEPLQLLDDLLGRAQERRVVEHERVLVFLDPGIALRPRTAGEIADVLEDLAAGNDGSLALLFVVHDLQAAGDVDPAPFRLSRFTDGSNPRPHPLAS